MARPLLNVANSYGAASTGQALAVTVVDRPNRVAYAVTLWRDSSGAILDSMVASSGVVEEIVARIEFGGASVVVHRVKSPPVGAFSMTPTLSAAREHTCMLVALDGVDQTTPNGTPVAVNTGTTPVLSATSNVTDDQLLFAAALVEELTGGGTKPQFDPTGTATQEELCDEQNGRYYSAASIQQVSGTPITNSWSFGTTPVDASRLIHFVVNGITSTVNAEKSQRSFPRGVERGINRGLAMVRSAAGLLIPDRRLVIPVGISL